MVLLFFVCIDESVKNTQKIRQKAMKNLKMVV